MARACGGKWDGRLSAGELRPDVPLQGRIFGQTAIQRPIGPATGVIPALPSSPKPSDGRYAACQAAGSAVVHGNTTRISRPFGEYQFQVCPRGQSSLILY